MRSGTFPDGTPQDFYFPDNHPEHPEWFKGMEVIICEHSLWPEAGLPAKCKGFKCEPGATTCCCCHLLFNQPDFVAQKLQLEELVTLGANPYLPIGYMVSTWWVLKQNTQHGPIRSMLITF